MDTRIIEALRNCISENKKVNFLVGAGLSAESGIPTFRGKDGFWKVGSVNYKAQEIATQAMFQAQPQEVWKWYLHRISTVHGVEPNTSHHKLKQIEDLLEDSFVLISQNVDNLHLRAGNSLNRTHLIHGDTEKVRCNAECTTELYPFPAGINTKKRDVDTITDQEWKLLECPKCGERLRPHVLWFDEYYNEEYYRVDSVMRDTNESGILFVIGTSGATTLPVHVVKSMLVDEHLVVEVNIDDNYFTTLIGAEANGVILRQKSSEFLIELYNALLEIKSK